ncbi:N-acetylglucosamine kinase [Reichenbachiella sp. MALMAid0571]|uniref:N-acetylglucosamine kinase n=1 Tax=Reichenbachiella sp. MALMAid0571 TaxID=3143939 RepID=UPI0032DE3C03
MILIADSGSTKTEWRLIDADGSISQIKSAGINPYYQDEKEVMSLLQEGLSAHLHLPVDKIYFYGAGCSSDANKQKMTECFQSLYPNASIEIDTDLLAAARSLCGHERGIACILGTGANSCLYDGVSVVENIAPLGYIMGDEGSGAYFGNKLLGDYLRKDLPQNLIDRMDKRFDLSKSIILENVYQNAMPARYLAGFSKFIFQNLKEPYLYKMIYDGFVLFFEKNIMKYTDYKNEAVNFTGSVSFYYSNILRKVAADLGIHLRHIVEGPIAGLTLYHQKEIEK